MVLEEAVSPQVPSASDPDSYSSSTPDTDNPPIYLSYADLPKPMPVIGPLLGYDSKGNARMIHQHITGSARYLGRPPTQQEAEAIAFYAAKANATATYFAGAGIAAGLYRWNATRESYRFPFMKVPPNFNPDLWPTPNVVWLRGQMARSAWHVMRGLGYGLMGCFFGLMFGKSYGGFVGAVSMQKDPRLRALTEGIQKFIEVERKGLPQKGQAEPHPAQQPAGGLWGPGSSSAAVDDDMSPTAGNYNYTGQLESRTDTGVMSDDQVRQQQIRQQPTSGRSPTESPTFQLDRMTRQPSTFDEDSPTGGAGPLDSSSSGSNSGESVWERIRRQAAAGGAQEQQQQARTGPGPARTWGRDVRREQGEDSSLGDSFTFSATEEERQLAKAEAQKEFDARIERERGGKDFQDTSKKW